MSHVIDPRLVPIPEDHRAQLAELVESRGITEAMRVCGIGRAALLAVIARGRGMPGTAALIREFVRSHAA